MFSFFFLSSFVVCGLLVCVWAYPFSYVKCAIDGWLMVGVWIFVKFVG